MPRRNRVTPWGGIVAVAARGTILGNRGVLVGANGEETRRRWTTHGWIACDMNYQGRKRPVAPPGHWTALFFSDDSTALAAGHRPCGFCRRDDYMRFKAAWARAHGAANAKEMDARLHADRLVAHDRVDPRTLPDYAFVGGPEACWRIEGGRGRLWSWSGYGAPIEIPPAPLVTPPCIVRLLEDGYAPGNVGG